MCGRFSLEEYPKTILEDFDLPTFPRYSAEKFTPKYNIAPSANILTIFKSDDNYELAEMNWGLVPPWAKPGQFKQPLINARSETVWEKPSFKSLIKSKRCLILASGFYEWNRSGSPKQPYRVTINEQSFMAMAGVYQVSKEGELQSCIITMQANERMAKIHHRMPVMVEGEHRHHWLDADKQDAVNEIIRASNQPDIELRKVSTYVNSASNQGAECIQPV